MRNEIKADTAPPDTIEAYIAQFPSDVQKSLQKIRTIVQLAAPGATEAIKYQIPTFPCVPIISETVQQLSICAGR